MATTVDIEKVLSDLAAEIAAQEAQQTYKGYTIADLRTVFDRVCDPKDWKGAIVAVMPGEVVMMTVAAIEFFTATVPTVQVDTSAMRYVVISPGYRQGPAGDH